MFRETLRISSRPWSTNARTTATAFLALLCYLPFSERIPARGGLGYDGLRYGNWVKSVPISMFPDGPRPPYVRSDLDSYNARRWLPSTIIHYAMRALGVPRTTEKIIAAFVVANLSLLTLSLYCWCRAADALGLALRGKLIGLVALLVSYANLKMPFFYPVLTDTFALALGSLSILLYLERRTCGLALITVAGGFVWPTIPYFGFLLLAFPRASPPAVLPDQPGPQSWRGAHTWVAFSAALLALAGIAHVVREDYAIPTTPVKPLLNLIGLSASLTALYLFFGLRTMLDSPALWQALAPFEVLRRRRLWLAGLLLAAIEAAVACVQAPNSHHSGGRRFAMDTLLSSVNQPGIFYLAHVLFFGPILVLLPFLWRRMCLSIQRQGTGLILCFALATVIGAGSESRKLMNFYPIVALFLAEAVAETLPGWGSVGVLAFLSLAFSKVWLPMDHELTVPWLGTVGWRELYVSSRGPWIDHDWYLLQGGPVLLMTVFLGWWCLRGPDHPRADSSLVGVAETA